jgi:hypothetical protein
VVAIQRSSRALRASAEKGLPPTMIGTLSPMRRLNSRQSRSGWVAPRRTAASPTRTSPVSVTNTVDGTIVDRWPSDTISVTPLPVWTAAAE